MIARDETSVHKRGAPLATHLSTAGLVCLVCFAHGSRNKQVAGDRQREGEGEGEGGSADLLCG